MVSGLTFCLECGQDSLDHSPSNPLSLSPPHQVNVDVGGVIFLEAVREEELQVVELTKKAL